MKSPIKAALYYGALAFFITMSNQATAADRLNKMSGEALFGRYCVSCHGPNGRGDGPVAAWFTVAVPDLTLIALRYGGKFPSQLISEMIDGRRVPAGHGTGEMPVWGERFVHDETEQKTERETRLLIARMVEYIESIQQPSRDAPPNVAPAR